MDAATATLSPLPLVSSSNLCPPNDDNDPANNSTCSNDRNRLVAVAPAVATFAAVAAAAVLLQQQAPPQVSSRSLAQQQQQQQQPLLHILWSSSTHQVNRIRLPSNHCDVDAIQSITLPDLEHLLTVLSAAQPWEAGHAPGFYTQPHTTNTTSLAYNSIDTACWQTATTTTTTTNNNSRDLLPYQTLPLDPDFERNNETVTTLPVPSPKALCHALTHIRTVWMERLEYLRHRHRHQPTIQQHHDGDDDHDNKHHANHHNDSSFCSCITYWKHPNSLTMMANQVLEQMMTEEASEYLNAKLPPAEWEASYHATGTSTTKSSSPVNVTYVGNVPVTLLADRDTYLATFTRAALATTRSIQIMTCYLFTDDPAQHYILFDLLPYLVRTKGIQVQLLIDLLPMESAIMKSVLQETAAKEGSRTSFSRVSSVPHNITATSFVAHLPSDAPADTSPPRSFASPAHFLQALLDQRTLHIQFWCARDAHAHYRIKNHAKCAIFDGTAVILGGSNLTPTVKSATSDLDVFLAGADVVAPVTETFVTLWQAMKRPFVVEPTLDSTRSDPVASVMNMSRSSEQEKTDHHMDGVNALVKLARTLADDPGARVATLRSTPSSAGEDTIYRYVLEQIRIAKKEVLIAMGHSCYPKSLAHVVAEAVNRGVTVKILVNSLYSNDLRTGQQDLFQSLAHILRIAPAVQVYATMAAHHSEDGTILLPEFLHGKFVVIDRVWCAVGSWNLWTRSAFHEIEHEALIRSEVIAVMLAEKFHRDQIAHTVLLDESQCRNLAFRPKGCSICRRFGPFFADC